MQSVIPHFPDGSQDESYGELASTSKNTSGPLTTNNDYLKHPLDLSVAISLREILLLAKDVVMQ